MELLYGHAGTYKTYLSAGGALRDSTKKELIRRINRLANDAPLNQTFFFIREESALWAVAGCCAPQQKEGRLLSHAILVAMDRGDTDCAQTLCHSNFAGEDSFYAADAAGGVFETGSLPAEHFLTPGDANDALADTVSDDNWAAIAALCLYEADIGRSGRLALEVPADTDYLAFCRHAMAKILRCVPAGLLPGLSFSTGTDSAENFVLCFVPAGRELSSGMVRLRPVSESIAMPGEINEDMARVLSLLADGESLSTLPALSELEERAPFGTLRLQDYTFAIRRARLLQQPDARLALLYGETAASAASDSIRVQILCADLQSQPLSPEALLTGEPALSAAHSLPELDAALQPYAPALRAADCRLGERLSHTLLQAIRPQGGNEEIAAFRTAFASSPVRELMDPSMAERFDTALAAQQLKKADERLTHLCVGPWNTWDRRSIEDLLQTETDVSLRDRLDTLAADALERDNPPRRDKKTVDSFCKDLCPLTTDPVSGRLAAWHDHRTRLWQQEAEEEAAAREAAANKAAAERSAAKKNARSSSVYTSRRKPFPWKIACLICAALAVASITLNVILLLNSSSSQPTDPVATEQTRIVSDEPEPSPTAEAVTPSPTAEPTPAAVASEEITAADESEAEPVSDPLVEEEGAVPTDTETPDTQETPSSLGENSGSFATPTPAPETVTDTDSTDADT